MLNTETQAVPSSDDLAKRSKMQMRQSELSVNRQAELRSFLQWQVVPRIEAAMVEVNGIPPESALEQCRWEGLMVFISKVLDDLRMVSASGIPHDDMRPEQRYLRDGLGSLSLIVACAKEYEIPAVLVTDLCDTQETLRTTLSLRGESYSGLRLDPGGIFGRRVDGDWIDAKADECSHDARIGLKL